MRRGCRCGGSSGTGSGGTPRSRLGRGGDGARGEVCLIVLRSEERKVARSWQIRIVVG